MVMRLICRFFFWITGWKIQGDIPPNIDKLVMIAAPHTSNWDFVFARAAFIILNIPVKFLAKKELFFFPANLFFKMLGGIPVDRESRSDLVTYMVKLIEDADRLVLLIPAEGTRKPVKDWKSGFYYTALYAKVPIVLGYLDYKKKIGGIGPVINPGGDYEADMREIKGFFSTINPKYPENFEY